MRPKGAAATAARIIEQWYEDGTALDCASAVFVNRMKLPPLTLRVVGKLAVIEDHVVLKAAEGSFMVLPPLSRATTVEVEQSWEGTMLTLRFENAGFVLADYELPPPNEIRPRT